MWVSGRALYIACLYVCTVCTSRMTCAMVTTLRAKKKWVYPENKRDLVAQWKSCSCFCLQVSNLREISHEPTFAQLVFQASHFKCYSVLGVIKSSLLKCHSPNVKGETCEYEKSQRFCREGASARALPSFQIKWTCRYSIY